MSRQIRVRGSDPALAAGAPADGYLDKLVKYVPAEIVAGYLAADGILRSSLDTDAEVERWLWGCLVVGLILTPLYLWRVTKVAAAVQLVISTIMFGVWVFAIGGPFEFTSWYQPFIGGLLAILATLLAPIVDP